jgi:ABC-2 type transport system ATP-binding protein
LTDIPVLDLQGVRKSYGKTEALKGVTFSVARSRIIGLLGPNGAGKSTLFQIAAGLFAPDAGTVRVFGLDYRRNAAQILSRLGVVFQARAIDLDMTVTANLRFHAALFGLGHAAASERIDEVGTLLEINDMMKKPVRTLSGGNQRRVEVARAMLNRPDLLLMDEPTVGLDPTTRKLLVRHLHTVREQNGTSILWATHIVEELEDADHIVLIRAGEIVGEGTPAELIARTGTTDLTDAYIALTGKPAAETSAEASPA